MLTTLTIAGEKLAVHRLDGAVAELELPAARDYPASRAILTETCGLFSSLQWKSIAPIDAGQMTVELSAYAGHNYFYDCLGDKRQ